MRLLMGFFEIELLDVIRRCDRAQWLRRFSGVCRCVLFLGAVLSVAAPIHAQYRVKVQVDTSKSRAMFYPTALGTAPDVWDGNAYSTATI